MASASLSFPSLQLQFHTPQKTSSSNPYSRRLSIRPITASVSEKPSLHAPPTTVSPSQQPTQPPIRKIPGNYGLPFIGPIKDRLDYFYNLGREEFFKSKMQKYQSTVFRTNMPPGPFISHHPNVVALLDGKSFPILFDVTKVGKRDLFTGTFMPSTELTGGYRVLSYLDPDQAAFNFLARSLYGTNPADTKLGLDGPTIIPIWVLFQLSPILSLGLPKLLEELSIHTFRLPPFLVKKNYQRLYDFFYESSGTILDEAERLGISREEACHNLLFATCFNSFGGMKFFFPNVVKWIGRGGVKLHTQLAEEIRSVVRSNGGKVTMAAMEQMPLMKSVVYEAFRIEPPVPFQYGIAKKDMIVSSHDASFEVKKGELLFGYQPFATKDPKIFERAEDFLADRFVGEGEKLLKHVLWSNGPETEKPTVGNKQCAGKDFVVLITRLLVVELFLRYDSFEMEVGTSALGSSVTVTSLKRASF
ncbi:hypothetical protein Pint_08885 [Pistacia integerrima]|uniref:Uncharacterized protein n=1 Tax=Pistacia integerrima TaxID=434235 RepID=A0ACC0XWV5_9ROSI|nr:hypothetical protein Pint_08885 [Pistacia integerrima]